MKLIHTHSCGIQNKYMVLKGVVYTYTTIYGIYTYCISVYCMYMNHCLLV